MPQNKKSSTNNKKKNNNKRTDNAILASIIALVLVFTTLLGVYAFQNFAPRKGGFRSGGGGGIISSAGSANGDFELDVSKHDLSINDTNNTVCFYAIVGSEAQSVNLTDSNGNILAEMLDNGDSNVNGDEYAGDGIYSAKLRVDTSNEANFHYRATANNRKSNIEIISVIAPLTNSELNDIEKVDKALEELRNSDEYREKPVEDRKTLAMNELKQLANEGLIDADSIVVDEDNKIITFYYSSGIIGSIRLTEFSNMIAGHRNNDKNNYNNRTLFANRNANETADLANIDAIVLYAWGAPNSDEWRGIYNNSCKVRDACRTVGFNTTLDSNVTVEDLKNLTRYEFVYLGAHGIYTTFSYKSDEKCWFFFNKTKKVSTSAFALLEKATKEKNQNYSLALKSGRIIKSNDEYLITSAFFEEYYGRSGLENSIFFLSSCQLMGSHGNFCEDWSSALTSKSIKAFVAFHNSVYIDYGHSLAIDIIEKLSNGETIERSLEYAKDIHGDNHSQWYDNVFEVAEDGHPISPAAYPVLRGDKEARLVSNDGSLSGKVADSNTRSPISGVAIQATNENNEVVSTSTDATGNFYVDMAEGEYNLLVQASGYVSCHINDINITSGETTYLENTILLTEQEGEPISQAGGVITNAVNGDFVEGAQLKFRQNWNNKKGAYIQNANGNVIKIVSDENGKYFTDELPYGYYTAEITKSGYATQYVNIIASNQNSGTLEQNIVLVPEANGNDFRITLEWDENPRDEDAHIVGDVPGDFHVYYRNKSANINGETIATLDHDDTRGNGFETVTLKVDNSGTYKYYVYHYAGSGSLSTSNAIVKVYQGNVMIKQYNVPVDQGTGRYWNVFNIVNGEVVTINRISNSENQ